jgi:hypothetical protein
MSETYLSSSGIVTELNPDILPELSAADFNYTAPCAIRQSSDNAGDGTDFQNKVLSGTFMTNDTRNDPGTLFITAYRKGPDDGAEIDHFYNGYGVAIMPLNAQAAADGRYNIYVVDNALATRQVVLENVVHTGWGDLSYLAAVSATLDPETEYSFELHFGAGGTLEFYMAEKGSPLGAAKITYGSYQHQAQGTYYGVSASKTAGYTWSIDNIALSYKTDKYACSLFLLDGSVFSDTFNVKASAYGMGYDVADPLGYGIKMYVLNYSTDPYSWDLVDSHTNGPGSTFLLNSGSLSTTTYMSSLDDYIRVLLVADNPSSFSNSVEGYLFVDTVYAENWNTGYTNVGGRGDIYLHETSQPTEYQIDMYGVDDFEWLRASNDKIQGDFHLPMPWITKVEQINASGIAIATLVLGIDYTIEIYDEYKRFSSDEQTKIHFTAPGINVRVTYLSFPNVESVQDYIDNEYRRNTCDDYLAFVNEPWELFITLNSRGSYTRSDLRTALTNYVMGEVETTLTESEIDALLQALDNVTSVEVDSMTVYKHRQDGTIDTETATTLTLDDPGFQQFMLFNDSTHILFTADSD